MERYEPDDEVTFYFVIYDDGNIKSVKAWSDNKDYVKIYMKFHECKHYRIKKVTNTYTEICKLLNESGNDEIMLYNLQVKDEDPKKHKSKTVAVPLTRTEGSFISEEIQSFMASRINYGYANEAFGFLKNKYQKALKGILFKDVMEHVVYQKRSHIIEQIELDGIMILFRSMPEQFGR